MAQQSNRPFESLDWYRDAARRGFAEDDRDRGIIPILTGSDLLRLHVSVFSVTVVVLTVINLLRSPESIWVDGVILVWALLLLIHGIAVGAAWAIRQWNADDLDEPVRIPPSQWQQAPPSGWGAPGAVSPEVQEAQFRPAPPPETQPTPAPWADWTNTAAQEIPESERASWSEATVTSWLQRRSQQSEPADKDQPEA